MRNARSADSPRFGGYSQPPMRAYLIRIGVDQAYGGWNAPMDPQTREFVYVPIPESRPMRAELRRTYEEIIPALDSFERSHASARPALVRLPYALQSQQIHLDPDFSHLTYGDSGTRRGKGLTELCKDDVLVFYAGLKPVAPSEHQLVYALIGLYRILDVVRAGSVPAIVQRPPGSRQPPRSPAIRPQVDRHNARRSTTRGEPPALYPRAGRALRRPTGAPPGPPMGRRPETRVRGPCRRRPGSDGSCLPPPEGSVFCRRCS